MTTTGHSDSSLAQLRERLSWPEPKPLSLVSFTIAGVQDFLAAARTTRDIWNGSYLVSYLTFRGTKALLEGISREAGRAPEDVFRWVLMPDVSCQPLVQHWVGKPVSGDLRVANFPNSVLAVVPVGKEEGAKLAGIAEEAVETAWGEILTRCEEELTKRELLSSEFAQLQWDYQTPFDRVFELYWCVLEIPEEKDFVERLRPILAGAPGSPNSYAMLIEAGGRVLGSRKMLRDFAQIGQEGDRCSLCGARTALADYAMEPRTKHRDRGRSVQLRHGSLTDYWKGVHKRFPHRFHRSEHLCAVCLVRRLAPLYYFPDKVFRQDKQEIQFPSTGTLCTASAVADLVKAAQENPALLGPMQRFLKTLKEATAVEPSIPFQGPMLPYFEQFDGPLREFAKTDGDWFYLDHYNAISLAREYGISEEEARRRFPENLAATLKAELRKLAQEFQPSNYFCLIRADGDHMGEWICGRMKPGAFNPEWHANLSAALARFAERIRPRLECQIPGKLVYAGGDDLLAFVPRERVLDAIQAIDQVFGETAGVVAPSLTVSMGCILARHNDPLSAAMKDSDSLLKDEAKEKFGRKAFAIRRTTGGGEVTGMPVRWREPEPLEMLKPLEMLLAIYQAMADRVKTDRYGLSARIVPHLDQLKDGLTEWENMSKELSKTQREMLVHATGRHFTPNSNLSKEDRDMHTQKLQGTVGGLYDMLAEWRQVLSEGRPEGAPLPPNPFVAVQNLLTTLRFLTREGR